METVARYGKRKVPKYGKRKVPKMYAQINELRSAIASEGTPAIQAAWDRVEEHIDFIYSKALNNVDNA